MRKILLLVTSIILVSCNTVNKGYSVKEPIEFDWMPDSIMWQNNIRMCRAQPQCNAADLFRRN